MFIIACSIAAAILIMFFSIKPKQTKEFNKYFEYEGNDIGRTKALIKAVAENIKKVKILTNKCNEVYILNNHRIVSDAYSKMLDKEQENLFIEKLLIESEIVALNENKDKIYKEASKAISISPKIVPLFDQNLFLKRKEMLEKRNKI